jgi:hypothetical protein
MLFWLLLNTSSMRDLIGLSPPQFLIKDLNFATSFL